MTTSEFKKIGRLLKQAYADLEQEALKNGLDLLSDDYNTLFEEARNRVLQKTGFTLDEYRKAKVQFSTEEKFQARADKEMAHFGKPTPQLTKEEVTQIAKEVFDANVQPPQIINQIVKETVVEKPIKETQVINQIEKYDDKEIMRSLSELMQRVDNIKIPLPYDDTKLREDLKGFLTKTLKENIDMLGMPDFRKLAMGLQNQIDQLSLSNNTSLPTFTEGSIPFSDSVGVLTEDNTNLYWDNTNKQLRIGSPINVNYLYPEFLVTAYGDFGSLGSPDFVSFNIQNISSYGSSDYVVANDLDDGTVLTGLYGDFGIAGSTYVPVGGTDINQPNDVYLYSSPSAGNLNIYAIGAGKKVRFATAGDSVDEVRAEISDSTFTIFANKDTELITTPLVSGDWTATGGWSVTGGELVETSNAGPNTIEPATPLTITAGVTYRVVITASATSGSITYTLGGVTGSTITATTITDFITATTTGNLIITGAASSTATITSVSVRALVNDTGDLFVEGNLKLGSTVQNTAGANLFSADGTGVVTFASFPLTPSSLPTTDYQVANKLYVDSLITGSLFIGNTTAATTAALPACTYNNGTSGVGATLTGNANGALAAQDGITLALNDTLLVKNQATAAHNGAYTLTQVGNAGAPFILTRMTTYDQQAEIVTGTYFTILTGSTLALSQWAMTTNATITVGTTAINFGQLSASTVYSAGTGLSLTGTTFSAKLNATGAIQLGGTGNDELLVAVDNSSIERASNAIRVKALGITNAMLAGSILPTKLSTYLTNTATLDFPNTAAQTSSDLTITLTGAALGDAIYLGVPNASVLANSSYSAWVSAANTVTVRFNNHSSSAKNPASGTFRVTRI